MVLGVLARDLDAIWAQDGPKPRQHQKSDFQDPHPKDPRWELKSELETLSHKKNTKKYAPAKQAEKKQISDDTRSGPKPPVSKVLPIAM